MNQFLSQPAVNGYIEQLLGERKAQFMVAMTTLANSNDSLKQCDRNSLLAVALTATGLNLEMNQAFGQAWAVAYNDNKKGCKVATFQIGVNGLKQLAMRTGQYKKLNAIPVYKNQFISWNALEEELDADFSIDGEGDTVGYVAFFELLNGFKKTIYWSKKKCEQHGRRFSKAYDSFWTKDFDAMALKTVTKQLIKNWGIMSTEMQTAITRDQSTISINTETGEETISYLDNPETTDVQPTITKAQASEIIKIAAKDQAKSMSILNGIGYAEVKDILASDFELVKEALSGKPEQQESQIEFPEIFR